MNSSLLTPTRSGSQNTLPALRSPNTLTRTVAMAAACLLGAGAIWAQSPPAAGSTAGGKVGVISIRQAIVTTAEGKLASAELQSQFASRQNEIENLNKQISDLQQRLTSSAGKLSQEEEGRLRHSGNRHFSQHLNGHRPVACSFANLVRCGASIRSNDTWLLRK